MPLKRTTHAGLATLHKAQAGKTNDHRRQIAQTILNALQDDQSLDTMLADINRAERGDGIGLEGVTPQDLEMLTAILGTEPDADDIEIFLAAEKAVLEKRRAASAGEEGQEQSQGTVKTGLGSIPLVASSFDAMPGSDGVSDAVDTICAFPDELSAEEAKRLYLALRHSHMEVGIGASYGADFDVSAEIGEQIALTRAMRARLISEEGKLNEHFSAKEAKEIMGASNALNQTLMKFQAQITNFQRLIKVENAVKAALSTLPREAQELYLKVLEEQLQADGK